MASPDGDGRRAGILIGAGLIIVAAGGPATALGSLFESPYWTDSNFLSRTAQGLGLVMLYLGYLRLRRGAGERG
jgi:hypothetical protein